MHIALQVPAASRAELDENLRVCDALRIDTIELNASVVETLLGKPTVPPWWIEIPENAFETGALPLEEEILQDEVDLARQSYDALVHEWRSAVSLAPLEDFRNRFAAAGIALASLSWTDLSRLSDRAVDYAFDVTKASGASAVVAPLVTGEPRRLAAFAERHAMPLAFRGTAAARPSDLEAALAHSPGYLLSLDLDAWTAGQHGSPLPFLCQHLGRFNQIYVDAARIGAARDNTVSDVLREIQSSRWPVRVTLTLDDSVGIDRIAVISAAVDYCLNGLRLST